MLVAAGIIVLVAVVAVALLVVVDSGDGGVEASDGEGRGTDAPRSAVPGSQAPGPHYPGTGVPWTGVQGTAEPGTDDPAAMVDRTWILDRVVRGWGEVLTPEGTEPTFRLSAEGQTEWQGCNGAGGTGQLVAGHLDVEGWMSTLKACEGETGVTLMELDGLMARLISAAPEVELRGERLTISHMDVQAHFVEKTDGDATGTGIGSAE